jgi:hypothetical protein
MFGWYVHRVARKSSVALMWQSLAGRGGAEPDILSDDVRQRFPPSLKGTFGVHEALQVLQELRAGNIAIYDVTGNSPLTDITVRCVSPGAVGVSKEAEKLVFEGRRGTEIGTECD